jgi:hypothetical protein
MAAKELCDYLASSSPAIGDDDERAGDGQHEGSGFGNRVGEEAVGCTTHVIADNLAEGEKDLARCSFPLLQFLL